MTTVEFWRTRGQPGFGPKASPAPARRKGADGGADELTERKAEISRCARTAQSGRFPRPIARDGDLPLSFSQERLWFLHQVSPGSAAYNIAVLASIRARCGRRPLEQGLNALTERHETLRTTFVSREASRFFDAPHRARGRRCSTCDPSRRRTPRAAAAVKAREAELPFDLQRGCCVHPDSRDRTTKPSCARAASSATAGRSAC
jgi:hypothetical protein